jgi:hypothetical protein
MASTNCTFLSSSLREAHGLKNTIIAQCSVPAFSFIIVSLLLRSAAHAKHACSFGCQLIFLAFLALE